MAWKKDSYCFKHAGRLATSRCKQCHKPMCNDCCLNFGEDGLFCSEKCHTIYAQFATRAKQISYRGSKSFFSKVIDFATGLIKLAIAVVVIVVILMITGKQFGIGLRHNPNKTVPFDILLPQRTSSP